MNSKVMFIVSKFPCYDEAFILRELNALTMRMQVTIFSLRHSNEAIVHDEAEALLPQTMYVPYLFSWRVLRANLVCLITQPLAYLGALFHLIWENLRSAEFLLKSLLFFPKSVFMSHFVKKEGFAHIHAYWATYPAACAQVISQLSGVPFSFTGHAHDIYVNTVGLSQKVERASFVSTCTHQNKAYLSEFTPTHDSSKIFVNYHGLNLERFAVNSASRPDRFEILSVGTLQGHKGFPYLVEALGELKKKRVEFHCTIVGGGPLENQLRNQIRNLELKHEVTMTGALKQSDVIPYYKKADLLILMAQPEWHWGIPNVLIEALAAQTVVLTTRFGSVEELVEHEKTGILVPSKNPLIVAEHINRLARDEQLRARLARAGHEKVKANFDLEKNIVVFSEKLTGKVDEKSATRVA